MRAASNVDLKVVVLGASSVGKTSIINRYCNGTFSDDTLSTIGAGFFTHTAIINETDVTLMIWDTAGQERFRSVAPSLLRGANGVVLVYDAHSKESFDELDLYIEMFLDTLSSPSMSGSSVNAIKNGGFPSVLVLGNKIDLDGPIVPENEVTEWKRKNRVLSSYLVSAKTGENIEMAFNEFLSILVTPDNFADAPPLQLTAHQEGGGGQCPC